MDLMKRHVNDRGYDPFYKVLYSSKALIIPVD